jgi:hypothetical protein
MVGEHFCEKDGLVTAMTCDDFPPTARPHITKHHIDVDIKMPSLEVLLEPIGSTPFESTAIHTKAGFVVFSPMSSHARSP